MARLWTAIVGSIDTSRPELDLKDADKAAPVLREVGRALAEKGVGIVVYSGDATFIEPQVVAGYIQSGNAVVRSTATVGSRLARKIGEAAQKSRGFVPFVLLLDARDLEKVIAGNPLPIATSEPNRLHVIFLTAAPKKGGLQALEDLRSRSERFKLKGKVFYLHAPEGIGRSRLVASLERTFGVPTTSRNWRTMIEIRKMVKTL